MLIVCAAAVGGGLGVIVLAVLPMSRRPHDHCITAGSPHPSSPATQSSMVPVSSLLRRVLLSAAAGIALFSVTSWLVLLPVGFAGVWFLPGLLRSDGGLAARIEKVGAIAAWTEMMRDTLNAAAGLGQAVTAAARNAPDPIALEAQELAAVIEDRTVPIDRALAAFGHRLDDPAGDLVVLALSYAARNSAQDLAPLLANLADAARAEASMRVRIGIARARTRTAVRVITGVVLGLGTLLYVFDEPFLAPFATPLGQLALLGIIGLFAVGFAWLSRLSRPSEQPRLLYPESAASDEPTYAGYDGMRLPGPRGETATYSSVWGR